MPRLETVIADIEARYDPSWAMPWDAVGLVCGDPADDVSKVLLAVDPVDAVVDEAIATGAQLLLTHHPLFLGGTSSVAASTAKGSVVHRLVRAGIGLYVAHTNADVASPGVSDALAGVLALQDLAPLHAEPDHVDKIVTFVPQAAVDAVLDALSTAGAGRIGRYERCAFLGDGTGTYLPGAGASPTIGEPGRVERTGETRVEMVLPRRRRSAVVRALLAVHPYEEPAWDLYELAPRSGARGLGRVGVLAEATTLREFTALAADRLPGTAWGVRGAGEPDRPVRVVAVCGGSGGDLAGAARAAGADVLLTSDLKHHAASEALADTGVALVDAAHWATEWPWLRAEAAALATTVEAQVSTLVTDPWTLHRPSKGRSEGGT